MLLLVLYTSAYLPLRTAFPARTLADDAQTLAAAGLAPAATLCMRPLP